MFSKKLKYFFFAETLHKDKDLAEVINLSSSDRVRSTIIHTEQTIINVEPKVLSSTKEKNKNIENFRETVGRFGKGYYILLTDRLKHVQNIDVLCHVKWCAVFDLDHKSNHTGLLSRIGKKLGEKTLLSKNTWQDTKFYFSETSLTWIGMTGFHDRPESVITDECKTWKKKIKSNFAKILNQIHLFSDQYTVLTAVVFWPSDKSKIDHMDFLIKEIQDNLSANIVVVLQRELVTSKKETALIHLLEEESVPVVDLTIDDVCSVIQSDCIITSVIKSGSYQLPTSDLTNNPGLSDKDVRWLKEDLDVLYESSLPEFECTTEILREQDTKFFKGGTLPWWWWYAAGPGVIDIERDIHGEIVKYIRTRHLQQCKSGFINLYHNPGSGGTTLAQRVVWYFKQEVPCLQVKNRYESQIPDLFEKVKLLYDKTHLPVIVLVDGEEKRRAETLFFYLRDHITVVLVYVQRYWGPIENDRKDNWGNFWLRSGVSKREVVPLELQYIKQCTNNNQKTRINELSAKVKCDEHHSLLEFGLAVYDFKYSGIQSYVESYLKLEPKKGLKEWQKALAYLSLVYFFGQTSLPCNFFTGLLGSNKDILTIWDLPEEMAALVVEDVQEKRNNMIRISHHLIAKEVLNHILPFPKTHTDDASPNLSLHAKKKLAEFSIEFIKYAGKRSDVPYSYISYVMTKTFIIRNNQAVGENETHACNKKRPKISPLLEQSSVREPYTERFDIMIQLTNSFPLVAQFKAHLGRLYTICCPEKETVAENCFQEALELSLPDGEETDTESLAYGKKVDLMHIYHMYGNMKLRKVSQYTGRSLTDKPRIKTNFVNGCAQILKLVKEACSYFTKSRGITPLGAEECMGYICEIHVRIMFADFVNSKGGCKDVHEYMAIKDTEEAEFLRQSWVIMEELFLECFSAIDPDKMDSNVKICQEWYSALFKSSPGHLRLSPKVDDFTSRQLQIARIKLKYGGREVHGVLEKIDKVDDICAIVDMYEQDFRDYENGYIPAAKRTMDIAYKEWLYAIRHHLFDKNYSVEKVLKYVENWHEILHSPHSRFYLFVLKSILGFGEGTSGGNTVLLIESCELKEEVLKFSRKVIKPKYPREWLGRKKNGIRRLYPGLRFFGQIENREIKFDDLDLCRGSICPPNDKATVGYIDLYLNAENHISIKVFFVPARAEDNLRGSVNKNLRVEFVIGFSMLHGYEAFNVKRLKTITCKDCEIEVEILSNENKARCPNCSKFVSRKKVGDKKKK